MPLNQSIHIFTWMNGWGSCMGCPGGVNAAVVQAHSFSQECCWFRFGSQGNVPGAPLTGDEPLIWVCVPLMGLPDQLRMLSSLVNVELAHGGSQEPLPSSSRRRQSEEEGRRPVPGMGRTEVCGLGYFPFSKASFMFFITILVLKWIFQWYVLLF